MQGYYVYRKIQQFRMAGFSQRQVTRRLGINRKTVKRYWEMPVNEYEEMSGTICRMQYLDKLPTVLDFHLPDKPEFEYHDFMSDYRSPWVFNKILQKP